MIPPLDGVRVLDLTRLMPFSYGTQLLADSGADVLKLEAPGGEYGRGMPGPFRLTNRGKRSVTLDLRHPDAPEVFGRLLAGADVLVESFRPGFLAGLGLDYPSVAPAHPRLLYCSATGFGQTGPRARDAGHDLTYAGLAGLASVDGGPPEFPATPYVDLVAGWGLALAVALGVAGVARTGAGRHIDVAMADLALSLNVLGVTGEGAAAPGHPALDGYPWPGLMRGHCPCYGVFETADGRYLSAANVEPKFWAAFLTVIDRPDLAPYRFAVGEQGRWATAEIAAVLRGRTRDEWLARFAGADVCVAPVHGSRDALAEPQYAAREMVLDGGGQAMLNSPLRGARRAQPPTDVPEPGAHNDEVYRALGYTAGDLARLRDRGVI